MPRSTPDPTLRRSGAVATPPGDRLVRGRRSARDLVVLAGVGALLAAGWAACRGRPDRVRVVLISLDTLRWDGFAGTGQQPAAMPRLAAWAAGATVFERFFAATPSTQPTHASMFTGLHPWQHGMPKNGTLFVAEHKTVAERLAEAGFSTSAVVASFPVSRRFGFDQGFEVFEDTFDHGKVDSAFWRNAAHDATSHSATDAGELPEAAPFYSLADAVVERALARLDAAEGRRQFFWFHFFDPHSPYGDSAGGDEMGPTTIRQRVQAGEDPEPALRRARKLYDADLEVLDRHLETLFRRLARDEGKVETHVVLVSDHGEGFGEEGSLAHSRFLTEELVHVPLIIRSRRLEPGERLDVAGSVDVAPTLLALAGVAAEVPGRDLTRPVEGRPRVFGMRRPFSTAQREVWVGGEIELPRRLFYWVDADGRFYRGHARRVLPPAGMTEVPPGLEGDLRRLFRSLEQQLREGEGRIETVADPESRKKLEALGYTGG